MNKLFRRVIMIVMLCMFILPQTISAKDDNNKYDIGKGAVVGFKCAIGDDNKTTDIDVDEKVISDGILKGIKIAIGQKKPVIGEGIKVGAIYGIGTKNINK